MKNLFLATAIFLSSFSAFAEPSEKLVTKYLEDIRARETVEAQVAGFAKQYATAATPEQMVEINRYLNSVMGWEVVRQEYVKLIQDIFTAEELKASLRFASSPIGKSIAHKNIVFSEKASSLMAKNAQAFAASKSRSACTEGKNSQPVPAAKLAVVDIEKHQDSEHTYFVGRVTNTGNKSVRGVHVEVNLFQGDKFVDQYSTYIAGAIPENGERLFKVSCDCRGSKPAQHDSYRAIAIEGY